MTPVKFAGQTRYLNYSMAVMMEVDTKYGGVDALLEILSDEKHSKEQFEAFAWAFVTMANDGEQKIAHDGYESLPLLHESELSQMMQPMTFSRLSEAMAEEITVALNHEYTEEENEEIDLGLAELRKKKEKPASAEERAITLSD